MAVTLGTFESYNVKTGSSSLLTGLVSYWKMDESSGNIADSADSNNGTTTNVTYSQTGKIGTALLFDGTSFIGFGNPTNLRLSSTGSVSLWFSTINTTGPGVLISKWDGNTARNGYAIYVYNGYIEGDISDTSNNVYVGSTISVDTWYHFVVTWNGTNTIAYLNGSAVETKGGIATVATAYDFTIGRDSGTVADYFNGSMDEVGVWNRVLTSTEITTLYNSGNGKTHPFN